MRSHRAEFVGDRNARYVYLDPYEGAKLAVARSRKKPILRWF